MPVLYEIDRANGLIRTRCVGNVQFPEIVAHFETLVNDPDCPERLDVLLDLTQQTTLPDSEKLRGVTHEIAKIRDRVRFDACAIVAPTDALFGLLRMFEVFAQEQFRATRVFRTEDEAEQWLMAERTSKS
jgi:hypothetical protein